MTTLILLILMNLFFIYNIINKMSKQIDSLQKENKKLRQQLSNIEKLVNIKE